MAMNRTILNGVVLLTIASTHASACDAGATLTQANFDKLIACVNNLEAVVNNITNGPSTVRKLDRDVPDSGSFGGFSGTLDLSNTTYVQCPPYTWISGIQGFKTDGISDLPGLLRPLAELRYSCRGTGIKK
jgi:hypothetical protein